MSGKFEEFTNSLSSYSVWETPSDPESETESNTKAANKIVHKQSKVRLVEIDDEELKEILNWVFKEFSDFQFLIDRFIRSVVAMRWKDVKFQFKDKPNYHVRPQMINEIYAPQKSSEFFKYDAVE